MRGNTQGNSFQAPYEQHDACATQNAIFRHDRDILGDGNCFFYSIIRNMPLQISAMLFVDSSSIHNICKIAQNRTQQYEYSKVIMSLLIIIVYSYFQENTTKIFVCITTFLTLILGETK